MMQTLEQLYCGWQKDMSQNKVTLNSEEIKL